MLYVVLLNVMIIAICWITACDVFSCKLYCCMWWLLLYVILLRVVMFTVVRCTTAVCQDDFTDCPISTILLYMSKFVIDLLPWTLLFFIHIFKKPSVYFIAILNTKHFVKKTIQEHLCSLLCKLLLNVLLYWCWDSVVSKHKTVKGNFAPIL